MYYTDIQWDSAAIGLMPYGATPVSQSSNTHMYNESESHLMGSNGSAKRRRTYESANWQKSAQYCLLHVLGFWPIIGLAIGCDLKYILIKNVYSHRRDPRHAQYANAHSTIAVCLLIKCLLCSTWHIREFARPAKIVCKQRTAFDGNQRTLTQTMRSIRHHRVWMEVNIRIWIHLNLIEY